MQYLFSNPMAVAIPKDKRVRLVVDGLTDERVWLTAVSGEFEPNYQIMYSIGAEVFVNAFQDKLNVFVLKGMYAFEVCDGLEEIGEAPFMRYYRDSNINVATEPGRISYGQVVLVGFPVKLILGEYRQDGIDGYQFTLHFLGMLASSLNSRSLFGAAAARENGVVPYSGGMKFS